MRKWIISLLAATIVTVIAYFVSKHLFAGSDKTVHYNLAVSYEKNELQSPEKLLNSTIAILSMRLKDAGFISSHSLQQKDQSYQLKFDVEIKEAKDTQVITTLLKSKGRLAFWETYSYAELPFLNTAIEEAINNVYAINTIDKKQESKDSGLLKLMQQPGASPTLEIYSRLFDPSVNINVLEIAIKDTAEAGNIIRHPLVLAALPADAVFCYGTAYINSAEKLNLYIIKSRDKETPFLDNSHVKLAMPARQPLDNRPSISLELNNEGAKIWGNLTETNRTKAIAISMDNWVITAPTVTDKIVGGRSFIAGNFSMEEVRALVALMNTEPIPASIAIESSRLGNNTAPLSGRRLLALPLIFGVVFGVCLISLNFLVPKPQKPAPEAQNRG